MDITINKNVSILTIYKLEVIDQRELSTNEVDNEGMLIGFFDSIEKCIEVEKDCKGLPGFCLPTSVFIRTPYTFPIIESSNHQHVLIVQASSMEKYTEEAEPEEEIGVFLTEEEANRALVDYYNRKVGTIVTDENHITAIFINEYRINQRHWQEGFS